MRLRKTRRSYGSEINIAPLIDVVFLLIIFFMTVSQIARVEVEDVALPEANEGEAPVEATAGRFIVNVDREGRIIVGGVRQSINGLRGLLAAELAQRVADEITVLVRADRDAPWDEVSPVMQVCATQGIRRVRVAVIDPEGTGS